MSSFQVCDGRNDCGNWQDEPRDFCGIDECSLYNNNKNNKDNNNKDDDPKNQTNEVGGGCEQKCIDLPVGYMCACKDGYELVGNKTCHGKSHFFIRYVTFFYLVCHNALIGMSQFFIWYVSIFYKLCHNLLLVMLQSFHVYVTIK